MPRQDMPRQEAPGQAAMGQGCRIFCRGKLHGETPESRTIQSGTARRRQRRERAIPRAMVGIRRNSPERESIFKRSGYRVVKKMR
jgi:hypothetical protein